MSSPATVLQNLITFDPRPAAGRGFAGNTGSWKAFLSAMQKASHVTAFSYKVEQKLLPAAFQTPSPC